MRILLTSPTYPPLNSGLGNAVAQQAGNLARMGHKVVIATGGDARSTETHSDVLVERFALSGADSWLQPIKGDTDEYLSFLGSQDWDVLVLHAWQNWATDLALAHLDNIVGKCFVFSHCISTNVFYKHQPLRSLVRYLAWRPYWWKLTNRMAKLDGVFFLSSKGSDTRFDDLQVAKENNIPIHVIPNCLSHASLLHLERIKVPFHNRDKIIAVGAYQWQKGFDFVLRAYAASRARSSFPLHFYGQAHTDYSIKLQSLARELGFTAEQVVFHEGVSSDALMAEYANARLVLSGSYTECQPLALLDASATATPFVARATGCIESMQGGVAVHDIKEMTNQINLILEDPSSWEIYSAAATKAAFDVYHPQKITDILLNVLEASSQ